MSKKKYEISEAARNRAVVYLKELIENKAVVGERGNENIELVKNYLDAYGIEYNEVTKEGYKSIMTKKTDIVLNSHVDVVAGLDEQFVPYEEGNRLYGRGAADALGCAAALVVCTQELKEMGRDVTLMIVSDEEAGGLYGTKHLLDTSFSQRELEQISYAVVGEPTESFGFSVREKGILRIEVEVYGERGHPEKEKVSNAILFAADIIKEIEALSELDSSDEHYSKLIHVNPTKISGGVASNIIPDKVTIEYDIRFAYGISIDEILKTFEGLEKKYNCKITILKARNASSVDTNNSYFSLLDTIAGNPEKIYTNGASDFCYFFDKGVDGVVFGVKGYGWHKDSEYVEIDSLYEYIENIINLVMEADEHGL